ncbi:MAG: DUF488 domain-containing protein [Dehalococcoidia bacterium]|jgi:uncharacterized protein YeaO (DUF488 family)
MAVRLRRAYEAPQPDDGRRVLVERLWPRGVKKTDLRLDAWLKDLAPSDALRRWFGHDPARWDEFQRRYQEELRSPDSQQLLAELAGQARDSNVTLVYSARDEAHNNAIILRDMIVERLGPRAPDA